MHRTAVEGRGRCWQGSSQRLQDDRQIFVRGDAMTARALLRIGEDFILSRIKMRRVCKVATAAEFLAPYSCCPTVVTQDLGCRVAGRMRGRKAGISGRLYQNLFDLAHGETVRQTDANVVLELLGLPQSYENA